LIRKPPTPSMLFHHTHQRKKDNTWVDQRSTHGCSHKVRLSKKLCLFNIFLLLLTPILF